MEGAGNDFVIINSFEEQIPEDRLPALAVAVGDRHFGIGSDGLLVISPSDKPGHDFAYRMWNPDGSEAEMCGNGIRCYARFAYERGLTTKTALTVDTKAGTVKPVLQLDAAGKVTGVRVDMGEPRLTRGQLPMVGNADERIVDEVLTLDGQEYRITAVSMGNPHIMIFVPDVDAIPLAQIGPKLETHPAFPRKTNVHFVQRISDSELKMRTWERGAGITLACGTGASATQVAAVLNGMTGRKALIHVPGGDLVIEWSEADNHVYMTGPATEVFTGVFTKPY